MHSVLLDLKLARFQVPAFIAISTWLTSACGVGEAGPAAKAQLVSKSGSNVVGTVTFATYGSEVQISIAVTGAAPGTHGVHIHEVGNCDDDKAANAGGHWNPTAAMHGLPNADVHHLGDCGNLMVGTNGKGALQLTAAWSIGNGAMSDVVGHALIVHAAQDDGTTQPTGNSGDRQACGVIAVK